MTEPHFLTQELLQDADAEGLRIALLQFADGAWLKVERFNDGDAEQTVTQISRVTE